MSLTRNAVLTREMVDRDSRTIELAISSEEPVERFFGIEILDHDSRSIDLTRINDGRHPLLLNHSMDRQIGVVKSAWLNNDRVLRGIARFSKSAAGAEIMDDVQDEIRTLTSVGYSIDSVVEEKRDAEGNVQSREMDGVTFEAEMRALHGEGWNRKMPAACRAKGDQPPVYRVKRWTPFEVSIVAVPADRTVGVNRAAAPAEPATTKESEMTEAVVTAPAGATAVAAAVEQPRVDAVRVEGPSALELEQARQRGIQNLCRSNKIDDKIRDHWIATGLPLDKVSDDLVRIMEERSRLNPQSPAQLGLSRGETQSFSINRALLAIMDKDWTHAGFELECSRAIAEKIGRPVNPTTFFVPFEVQQRQLVKRDLTVASAAGGGYLVETQNLGFIDLLRNRSVAFNMGAIRLSGLQGSITVPKQTAGATAYWLSTEATAITEGNQTFGQMALSPKTVGAYTEISRQLLLQSSPDAEGIVTADLAAQVALAADLAVLNGSGSSGQPTGIIGTSGVGSTTATTVDYGKVLDFQTDVAAANIMPTTGGYVTTSAVSRILMTKQRFSSTDTPLWEGTLWDGRMAGFRAMSSEQVPSGYMIFGDWNKVVVAEWGVLEVSVNPFANFAAGIIGVRAMYSMDVGVRYPAAFSVSTSVTA